MEKINHQANTFKIVAVYSGIRYSPLQMHPDDPDLKIQK